MWLRNFFWFGVIGCIFLSCSTQKDRFLNRFYHATLTKYNILFNGKEAFKKANNERILAYRDNFLEILPVEALEDKSYEPIQGGLPLYSLVQQKVFKIIRNHSMEIAGVERNPHISKAYLMLSKAYYYEGRFKEALEILDYIIENYPLSRTVYEAKVWRENVRVQLGYSSSTVFNYRVLRRLETFMTQSLRSESYIMLSKTYLASEEEDKAIEFLKKGIKLVSNKKLKGRYYFILGQLYEKRKEYNEMMEYYNKVIKLKRRTKWSYYIHACLKKIEYAHLEGNEKKVNKWLKRLIRNEYENSDYYNFIYFRAARYNENIDSIDQAKLFYQKSIEAKVSSPDEYLMASAYESLGDLYFKEASFLKASENYMGAMAFYDKKTQNYQRVYFRHKQIRAVVRLEKVLQNMGHKTILSKNNKKTDERKRTSLNIQKVRYNEKKQARFYFNSDKGILNENAKKFQKEWGNRSLVDDWRRVKLFNQPETLSEGETEKKSKTEREKKADTLSIYDYDRIPMENLTKEQRLLRRDQAYYFLGFLYYNHLNHTELAIKRLESLLDVSSNMDYILPAYYVLFRAYSELSIKDKARKYKSIIEEKYPKSVYASMVNEPYKKGSFNLKQTNDKYKSAYKSYAMENYKQSYEKCVDFIKRNLYHPSRLKFKLLAALSLFKSNQKEEAKRLLEEIVLEYPDIEEAERADIILKLLDKEKESVKKPI